MSEDINRLKELSGIAKEKVSTEKQLLVEQARTWQEKLPDGTVRTHRYDYSDEKRSRAVGQGIRRDFGGDDDDGIGPGRGTGVGPGTGTGAGTYGTGPGSGTIGTGRGQVGTGAGAGTGTYGTGRGQTGTGQGYGTVPGSGNGQFGTGAGSGYGTIQRIPGVGSGGYPSTGYGSGTGTYGTSPDVGTYSTSPGYSRDYPVYTTPSYEPDDEPEPVERPQRGKKGRRQRVEPEVDVTPPEQEWDDIPGYVNPSWAREQERLRQLQQQPKTPKAIKTLTPPEEPKPVTQTPPVPKPIKTLTPPEEPKPVTQTPPVPKPIKSIAKDILIPPEEPAVPTPAVRKPIKQLAPQTITAPEPAQTTINVPTDTKPIKTIKKLAPEPKEPQALSPSQEPVATDIPVVKAPEKPIPTANAASQTPKVITTTEPSTFSVEPPSDKKDEPIASAPATAPRTGVPTTAEPAQPPAPADAPTSIAKDILLPQKTEPPEVDTTRGVEVMLISPEEVERIFGPMPGSSTSAAGVAAAPKGQASKGTPNAGSGSPGSGASAGAQGTAGASGQQGGGSSAGKKYVPITPKTMAAPISGDPSWAARQRAAQGTPFPDDPKIEPPKDITGTPGSIQAPNDANADIVSKGQKATVQMSPADAAKAKTNVFKPDTVDVEVLPPDSISPRELTIRPNIKPDDKAAERDGTDSPTPANAASTSSDTVSTSVPKDDKATESINRMLTLAGLK